MGIAHKSDADDSNSKHFEVPDFPVLPGFPFDDEGE